MRRKTQNTSPQLMGYSKLFMFSILFFLLFWRIRAVAGSEEDVVGDEAPDSALQLELEQFKSRISVLESNIAGSVWELKSKEDGIAEMERAIWKKSESIASLQREIELLREKGIVDTEEMVGKAGARAEELKKQIERLKSEVLLQSRKRDASERQATDAEKKVDELNLSLESLQKIHEEQKQRIKKAEIGLQVAKEGMKKVKLEVTSKKNELKEVHGAWLPPWLSTHWVYCQGVVATYWNKHGEPALLSFLQKASHISVKVQKQIEPHLETAKSKWIPALKEHWMTFVTHIEPYVQLVSTKIVEVFEASVTVLAPHFVRAKELAEPYFQVAKKCSKDYIDRVATATRPHSEKVCVALKPYTKRVIYAYEEILKPARTYHHQIQYAVQEKLRNHESTKALATEEFGWLVAFALLALPVFFLYRLFSSILCKIARKPARNADANHAHRRTRRRQPDK